MRSPTRCASASRRRGELQSAARGGLLWRPSLRRGRERSHLRRGARRGALACKIKDLQVWNGSSGASLSARMRRLAEHSGSPLRIIVPRLSLSPADLKLYGGCLRAIRAVPFSYSTCALRRLDGRRSLHLITIAPFRGLGRRHGGRTRHRLATRFGSRASRLSAQVPSAGDCGAPTHAKSAVSAIPRPDSRLLAELRSRHCTSVSRVNRKHRSH